MEQVYYTQCPLGYGLGASNGFQIKRKTAGYPDAADFRHLNMRPFAPGSRALAPKTLRYRRDGAILEIAWLVPRTHEYQTERGLWGRPGGLFAHGLRLAVDELETVGSWPAGLHAARLWLEEDKTPSQGKKPDAIAFSAASLACPPRLDDVSRLAQGCGFTTDLLSLALTAAARVTSDGRTLFLIGEDTRVVALIQCLTFAFPPPMRPELTFSTYHDRPEELTGFRLQGTTPQARPNRTAMLSLGLLLDLASGVLDPPLERAPWARDLADWVFSADDPKFAAWTRAGTKAHPSRKAPDHFKAAWLRDLADFLRATQGDPVLPETRDSWERLKELTNFAVDSRLKAPWVDARPATWWKKVVSFAGELDEAVEAFTEQAKVLGPQSPKALPRDWGATLAAWLPKVPADARERMVATFLQPWSEKGHDRASFLGALYDGLDSHLASEVLARLKDDPKLDKGLLAPIEARAAITALVQERDTKPIQGVLARAIKGKGAIVPVLDALERGLEKANPAFRLLAADQLRQALLDGPEGPIHDVLLWALSRGEVGETWLRPFVRMTFSDPEGPVAWRRIFGRSPDPMRPDVARFVGEVALEKGVADEAFRWCVEDLFLPLPISERPNLPAWPNGYVARVSFLDLVRRLYMKDTRMPALVEWLDRARKAGALEVAQLGKLDHCKRYARGLKEQDASWLVEHDLPEVPAADRGAILKQIVKSLGSASMERLELCLDSCRRSWPGAFEEGTEGLAGIAEPLARALLSYRGEPSVWFPQLGRILARLLPGNKAPFGPKSLAAQIVAATTRMADTDPENADDDPWPLRAFLLQRDQAWKTLAIDAGGDLTGANATKQALNERRRADDEDTDPALAVFQLWYARLDARACFTRRTIYERFYELMLNTADGQGLAAIACAKGAELPQFALPWWDSKEKEHPGACDDVREAFARKAPMAPLPGDRLPTLRNWLGNPVKFDDAKPVPVAEVDESHELVPIENEVIPVADYTATFFSPVARARWFCLHALSVFAKRDIGDKERWEKVVHDLKHGALPLDWLELDERYLFLAWLIHSTRDYPEVPHHRLAPTLVLYLMREETKAKAAAPEEPQVRCWERIHHWADELAPFLKRTGPLDPIRPGLMDFIHDFCADLQHSQEERNYRASKRRPEASPERGEDGVLS